MSAHSTLGRPVFFGSIEQGHFAQLLQKNYADAKILVLVDSNTHEYCWPILIGLLDGLNGAEIVEIPSGEEYKTLEICEGIWHTLTENQFSRKDLLIALGGGMVTDIGGFVAGLYKRGMDFWSIPTSLLGMVDASIGGKTGVDFGPFKNQIGLFNLPEAIFVDVQFLQTLSSREWKNGMAEMVKHGLIADWNHFLEVTRMENNRDQLSELIQQSYLIKNDIVEQDPKEAGSRKLLNFGHTVGHAIEGSLLHTEPMDHGLAVAHGMYVETILSVRCGLLESSVGQEILDKLAILFPLQKFDRKWIETWISLMSNDKKNHSGKVQFVLLEGKGKAKFDIEIEETILRESLEEICH